KVTPRLMIRDVATRWNSTAMLLQRAIELRDALKLLVVMEEHNRARGARLRRVQLSTDEWSVLNELSKFRLRNGAACLRLLDPDATKRPVLSFTHTVFRGLQEDLRKSIHELPLSTPSALRNGLIEAHRKLSDYYHKSDDSPFYTWAALLDPRISYEGLKADFYHDEDLMNDLEDAKSKLDAYFRRNYADKVSSTSVQATASAPVQSTSRIQASPQKDFTQRYRVERSAVAVERIFFGGRDTISLRRASLKPDTTRTLMIVKQHLRLARNAVKEIL
ncbi:hypothetical protein B0H10DRAFT_1688795, partial [Mycena sp. CBHHK59/15]